MTGIKKNKVKLPVPQPKQKKALNKWKQGSKEPDQAKPGNSKPDKKAARKSIVFVKPKPKASSEDTDVSDDTEQQKTVAPKLPVLEPVPTDIPDPQLEPRKIKQLQSLIGYIYNRDEISLKRSFDEAGLLLTPDYDEKTRVFRFLVNTKEMCRAEGEKNEAHSIAREKLVQIVRYYCYIVKRVKEYHTRRKIFYTRPPKAAVQAQKDQKKIPEENVGFQMLQKQGWNPGSSLGVSNEGIIEPVAAKRRKGKGGLGVEDAVAPDGTPGKKVKIPLEAFYLVLKQYAGVNALYDIVFSSQFSKHQVAKLKNFATSLKLLPQMIGHKKKLVVSRPLTIKQIKEGVMKGHSDLCAKYVVIPPAAGIPEKDRTL
uniref:G-patch domain-containing protein n=1 Tax=Anopheles minimus TaxID=112268 RepID=A0A182WE77_9DIPT